MAGSRPNHQPIWGSDPNHQVIWSPPSFSVCVYYYSTYYKTVRGGGGGVERGGHVLRETTSRGQCELVCPSRTNERGGEGYRVKGGGGEEGERERERAGRVRLHYSLGY